MKRIFYIAAIFSLLSLNAAAYSHLLNYPRIGDKMTVCILDGNTVKADSTRGTIDLSEAKIMSREKYSVWAPAPNDSVSSMIVITGRQQKYITQDKNNLFCTTEIKPGYKRYFEYPLPFAIDKVDSLYYTITSFGRAEAISEYTTVGTCNYKRFGEWTVINTETDTISNIDGIEMSIIEQMAFEDSTVVHKCRIYEWYAPGYRYPVLSHQSDVMLSGSNDTIDTNSLWIYIAPDTQEYELTDDPVNENIRRDIKNSEYVSYHTPKSKAPGSTPGRHDGTPSGIKWNEDHTVLTISQPLMTGDGYTQVILCDIQGRVYHAEQLSGNNPCVSIDVRLYNKGVYILYISTDSEPVAYRFIL